MGYSHRTILFILFSGEISGPLESLIKLTNYEFVKIFCYKNKTKFNNKDYKRYGTIPKKDLIHEEIVPLIKVFKPKEPEEQIPNVLLLFIDSVSYLNFERHFPLMKNFVQKHNFYQLRGYNKVGLNTWPNFVPLLTGFFDTELVTYANRSKIFFDNWPIIWKEFAHKGFRTIFTEEMAEFGLFTWQKKGFKYRPTDYYLRPFTRSIKSQKYLNFCYNGKMETEVNFILIKEFCIPEGDKYLN
jgi:hypothetical protein